MEEETPPPLLPQALRDRIPKLYATEHADDPIAQAKLFTPWASWTWFVTEFDGEDTCFGLVSGHEVELGYFSLSELAALEGHAGLRVERDRHFEPQPLSRVRQALARERGDPDGSSVREDAEELNEAAGDGPARRAPSPLERPGIRVIETRLARTGLAAEFGSVATPSAAASIFYDLIGEADREHFAVLLLDNKHRITHAHIVSRGTAQTTLVHPREVFKAAVLANAAALIIGHNHPSGAVQPSPEDTAVNERLERAGELLGIPVLDSIIVGPTSRFYAANLGGTQMLPRTAAAMPPEADRVAEDELWAICRGLMQDIDEVLERQGEEWWDETVTAGTFHRELAELGLGLSPYRPVPDDAEPAGPA